LVVVTPVVINSYTLMAAALHDATAVRDDFADDDVRRAASGDRALRPEHAISATRASRP
jgi:hypothetical protein